MKTEFQFGLLNICPFACPIHVCGCERLHMYIMTLIFVLFCSTNFAKESGFTGLSALHRLNVLYGFNILTDMVYDAMHNVPINVIRMHLYRYVEENMLPKAEVEPRLDQFPWTAGTPALKQGVLTLGVHVHNIP